MKNCKKILKSTVDNRVYKSTLNKKVLDCPICSPHRGCNRLRKKDNNSWKSYRKTQWRD